MERDLDLDLERLRDLEADFVDLDITALSLPLAVTQKCFTVKLGLLNMFEVRLFKKTL